MRTLNGVIGLALVVAALTGVGVPVHAQERAPREAPSAAQRDSMEQRVRARMAQMLRTQLGLNDEQLRQLQATNRKFEGQRRALVGEERRVRGELGRVLAARDTTQDARVAQLLDRVIALQGERIVVMEAEQRELATFLTPTQRARLYGMEEQIRRRMSDMRRPGPQDRANPQRPGAQRPGAPSSGGRRPGATPRSGRSPL